MSVLACAASGHGSRHPGRLHRRPAPTSLRRCMSRGAAMAARASVVLKPADVARFWSNVEKTETCWLWTGRTTGGYGHFPVGSTRKIVAHRVAWELERGPIPSGMVLDHFLMNAEETRQSCSRACVNPAHLREVTQAENTWASATFVASMRARSSSGLPAGLSFGKRKLILCAIKHMGRRVFLASRTDTPEHRVELCQIYERAGKLRAAGDDPALAVGRRSWDKATESRRPCAWCKTEIEAIRSNVRFCSSRCRDALHNGKRRTATPGGDDA